MKTTMQYLEEQAKIGYGHYPSMYRSYNYQEVCRFMEDYLKIGLTEYTEYLMKYGYCDEDVLGYAQNEPSAIDQFLILEPAKKKK